MGSWEEGAGSKEVGNQAEKKTRGTGRESWAGNRELRSRQQRAHGSGNRRLVSQTAREGV